MEPEVEGDEEDYYVASGYDELVGTPSTPSTVQLLSAWICMEGSV